MLARRDFLRTAAYYRQPRHGRSTLHSIPQYGALLPRGWELYDLEAARAMRMSAMYDGWAKRANVVPWEQLPKASGTQ
jgi:hypothetical protein